MVLSQRPTWFYHNTWAYKYDSVQWFYGPWPNSTYEKFSTGPCRGTSSSHNPATWFYTTEAGSLEHCQSKCSAIYNCRAIEWEPRGHCEIWRREPQATATTSSVSQYSCMKR